MSTRVLDEPKRSKILEALEDQDDVNHVYSNFDVDIKQLEEVAS